MLTDPTNPADAFALPVDLYTVPGEIVDPSRPILSFNYILIHVITGGENKVAQSLMNLVSLLVPSLELLKITAGCILAYGILLYSFSFCLRKFFKKSKGRNLQIQILAFTWLLCWFFLDQIYNGSISTGK